MKRALAERAKQSGLPNGLSSSSPDINASRRIVTDSRSRPAPETPSSGIVKIPRVSRNTPSTVPDTDDDNDNNNNSSENADGAANNRSQRQPQSSSDEPPLRPSKKRQREDKEKPNVTSEPPAPISTTATTTSSRAPAATSSATAAPSSDDEEEEDTNFSAFYLRHQNRALGSELKSLKYQLAQLERERNYRREQCSKACQTLNSLQATWTQMETALQLGQQPPNTSSGATTTTTASGTTSFAQEDNNRSPTGPPNSTGSGKSVELIGSLLDSLAALGNKPPREPKHIKRGRRPRKRRRRIREDENDDSDDDDFGGDQDDPDNSSISSASSVSSSSSLSTSQQKPPANTLMEGAEKQQLDDLLRITDNVSQRATTLQHWIWSLLRRLEGQHLETNTSAENKRKSSKSDNVHSHCEKLSRQLANQKAKNKRLKAQLKEVARARDEMNASDKRVRRGLYRLAAGRVQLKDVLKAIKRSDEDKEAAAAWMEVATPPPVAPSSSGVISSTSLSASSPELVSSATGSSVRIKLEGDQDLHSAQQQQQQQQQEALMDPAQVQQLQKQIENLELISSSRQVEIQKLLVEREDYVKRINSLIFEKDEKDSTTNSSSDNNLKVASDDEVRRSNLYAELSAKLATSNRTIEDQKSMLEQLRQEWSQALGNEQLAKTTMEELQQKHAKKWAELVQAGEDGGDDGTLDDKGSLQSRKQDGSNSSGNDNKDDKETSNSLATSKSQAELIVTLQHKLTQALENVRQADTTRQTLDEAISMNESLQAKLDEIKAKYSALQAGRSNSNHASSTTSSSSGATTPRQKSSTGTTSSSTEKVEKSERQHRDHRRMRKELAALSASKDAAKAKLERTEKERDALVQANGRLLKQAAEKDEMNAKSLSSILHLKQVTEQIEKEKKSLEQQAKSAQQLALAARLAANARERVAEEYQKERKALEQKLEEYKEKCDTIAEEKDIVTAKLAQQKSKTAVYLKDVAKAKERCEELATESTKLKEEKQRVEEQLAIARKEADEAAKQALSASNLSGGGGSGHSEFTVDQLSTQVSVLKGRLACPVCNHRDKKCILLRCRHMFCRQCVDENIKNRSRKCPACGGRFDTKDVADVWL